MEGAMLKRVLFAAVLLGAVPSTVFSNQKTPKTYPERGTVVAVRTEKEIHGQGVHTTVVPSVSTNPITGKVESHPVSKTHGGQSRTYRVPVSRVETETKFYELEGKHLELNQIVEFRIEKRHDLYHAFIREADNKERRYLVVAIEQKPDKTKQ